MAFISKHENLYDAIMRDSSFEIQAPCGGNHRCGKCKIRVMQGNLPIHDAERRHLSEEELLLGVRLACAHPDCEDDCVCEPYREHVSYTICSIHEETFESVKEEGFAVALDIGTTTIAAVLIDLYEGKILREKTFLNPQSRYGADVITRIAQTAKIGIEPLQSILVKKIEKELASFDGYAWKRMCVCGNPTMMHLFAGVDPSSIGQAPYRCTLDTYKELPGQQLFPNWKHRFVIQLLPPISAYVGSDVVMGLYSTQIMKQDKTKALIDLGTNGEMALYHDHRLYVTSAACGPAFEGGNMSCGSGAVSGALCRSGYDEKWYYETLEQAPACGICGSGYLSIFHQALDNGLLEPDGYLAKELFFHPKAVVNQKDVREFQLAKASVIAAFLCMCRHASISVSAIEELYIAGGFGKYAQPQDLVALGILPDKLSGRLHVLGNSALRGTCQYAIYQDIESIEDIRNRSESLLLAGDELFTQLFMEHMMLEICDEN